MANPKHLMNEDGRCLTMMAMPLTSELRLAEVVVAFGTVFVLVSLMCIFSIAIPKARLATCRIIVYSQLKFVNIIHMKAWRAEKVNSSAILNSVKCCICCNELVPSRQIQYNKIYLTSVAVNCKY